MTPIEIRNKKLGEKVVKALNSRHFEAYYCENKAEALEKALSLIDEKAVVGWGGSETCSQVGLIAALRRRNPVIDRDTAETAEARMELMRQALLSDVFVTGANAISEDGQIVNIDGNGNRVAAMTFGPKSVVILAGINKVVKNVDDALTRARTVAAPINAQRFEGIKTGCSVTGACEDCKGTDSICCYMETIRLCRPAGKIKVILIGEELGF